MKTHANARLRLKRRELLIDRVENAGLSLSSAAEAAGSSDRTARKWRARYLAAGVDGLRDRSSGPAVLPTAPISAPVSGDRCAATVADDRRGDCRVPGIWRSRPSRGS
jgi:hypothetical protein